MKVKILEDTKQGLKTLYDSTKMKAIGDIFHEDEDVQHFLDVNIHLDFSNEFMLSNAIHAWRLENNEAKVLIDAIKKDNLSLEIPESDINEDSEGETSFNLSFASYDLHFKIHHKWHVKETPETRQQPKEVDFTLISASIFDLEVYDANHGKPLRLNEDNKYEIEYILENSIRT